MKKSFVLSLILSVLFPFTQREAAVAELATPDDLHLNWFINWMSRVDLNYTDEQEEEVEQAIRERLKEGSPDEKYFYFSSADNTLTCGDALVGALELTLFPGDNGRLHLLPKEARFIWDQYEVQYTRRREQPDRGVDLWSSHNFCCVKTLDTFQVWFLGTEEQLRKQFPRVFRNKPERR